MLLPTSTCNLHAMRVDNVRVRVWARNPTAVPANSMCNARGNPAPRLPAPPLGCASCTESGAVAPDQTLLLARPSRRAVGAPLPRAGRGCAQPGSLPPPPDAARTRWSTCQGCALAPRAAPAAKVVPPRRQWLVPPEPGRSCSPLTAAPAQGQGRLLPRRRGRPCPPGEAAARAAPPGRNPRPPMPKVLGSEPP